ncbi:DUF998 domain-containing protein [Halorubrum lipolyticum]|uniref:DUF998 domain-containing protein n=1 Tax=Halorubrum lipolyticum DSM 21995 TaxID=1227482 RepID=M0NK04_9EURY|nr:DUF998 domain-containing protein [Halorubrum lipolyticum]EMA58317.1 hypothetical protein C469_13945 [Halorubrum lipolyticum DSM 21995]
MSVAADSVDGAATRALGAAATLFALGGIAVAILLDPTFSWASDALSDLGVRDPSAPAFNWGLVLGGLAGVAYAVGLRRSAARGGRTAAVRAAVLALAMIAMAGVGAFDLTEPLHGPAAVGFYALVTVAFAVDGLARRGTATGRVVLAFAPVHVAVWATFAAGWWPVSGLALPELPGALMLAAWVWALGPLPVLGPAEPRSGGARTDEH